MIKDDLVLIDARDLLFTKLLSELIINVTPKQLTCVRANAMTPKSEPTVKLTRLCSRPSERTRAGHHRGR